MKKISSLIILFSLAMSIFAFSFSTPTKIVMAQGTPASTREVFDFNSGWRFSKGEGYENSGSSKEEKIFRQYIPNASAVKVWSNSYTEGLNNETWTDVSLPHTYNDTDTFDDYVEALDNNKALSHNGERTMYGGTAWYKKTFFVPQSYNGKRVYVEFEAARQSAQIWVNGTAVEGTYLNGFIAFGYDLTDKLIYGANNTITVLVDNSYPYFVSVDTNTGEFISMYDDGSTTYTLQDNPIVWHDSHWHPNYGGLYRNSFLYVTSALHLTLPLYSFMETQGTYIYTSNENATTKTAKINIDSEIINTLDTNQTFDFMAQVKDMSNNVVGSVYLENQTITANASTNQKTRIQTSINIGNVKRWSPEYPYLYTVECFVFQNDVCIDNNENQIGVRTFRATTDGGFLINENYTYLNGWGQKSTMEWAGIGAAYPDWMQEYVVSLMKNTGANYIRWGHTAGGAGQIKAADKLGMIVTQPGVDGEGSYSGEVAEAYKLKYTNTTYKIRTDAFRDLIIYFRNSPSILFWEIGNQAITSSLGTTLKNYILQYDYAGRDSNGKVVNSGKLSSSTTASSRLITARNAGAVTANFCEVSETTEGSGGASGLPHLEGEYNRFEARRGVWDTSTDGFQDFKNIPTTGNIAYTYLTSETFAVYQVQAYYEMLLNKGLKHMGGGNWIFSDSISHGRLVSEVARASGEVDGTMLEKEAYYVNKVLFSDKITSHIIGHWNYTQDTVKDVFVVSKANSLTLRVTHAGGVDTYTSSSKQYGYLFTFNNVAWKAGTISVTGTTSGGSVIPEAAYAISTAGEPAGLRISNNVTSPYGLKANASDYLILDVELVDAEGNRCVTYDGDVANEYVNFSVTGENSTCKWLGGYNSSLEDTINSKSLYLEAGITRVALRTTQTAGTISVTATLGAFTKTFSINSSAVEDASSVVGQTFNYTEVNPRIPLDLTALTEPVYNSVPSVAPLESTETTPEPDFVESFESYQGSSHCAVDKLQKDVKIYLDMQTVFKTLPTEYNNGEFIKSYNDFYAGNQAVMFELSLKADCKMVIMFPCNADVPAWVTDLGFEKTAKTVITDVGIVYSCYEMDATAHIMYSFGQTDQINNYDTMYVVGFYKIEATSGVVTSYNNALNDKNALPEGSVVLENGVTSYPTTVTNDSITDKNGVNKSCLKFTDNAIKSNVSDNAVKSVAGVILPIGTQTGQFSVEFDAWIKNSETKYVRIILQNGAVYDDPGDESSYRLYLDSGTASAYSKLTVYDRLGADSTNANSKPNATSYNSSAYTTNTWYTYKLEIDTTCLPRTVKLYIKLASDSAFPATPVTTASLVDYNNNNVLDNINHIAFCTGGNGKGQAAFSNFKLVTDMQSAQDTAVSGISVGGTAIDGFSDGNYLYYMGEISATNAFPTASSINVTLGSQGVSSTVETDESLKTVTIKVTDINSFVKTYVLSYSYASQFERMYGKYLLDAYSLTTHEYRPHRYESLYETYPAYIDKNWVYTSIPYKYCGADIYYQKTDDYKTNAKFIPRTDTTLILMVHTHDLLAGKTVEGWTNTNEIVTLDNGYVFTIFTKNVEAMIESSFNFADFNTFSLPPILAFKSNVDIQSQIFFYDDFILTDKTTQLPFGWDALTPKNTSITHDEETGIVEFIDTSVYTGTAGNAAYIANTFSTQENLFTFETEINVSSTGNYKYGTPTVQEAQYIRVWLTDGMPDWVDAEGKYDAVKYVDNNNKVKVAVESYFHEKVSGNMKFVIKYNSSPGDTYIKSTWNGSEWGNNEKAIYDNLPKDTWFKIKFTVNPQNHTFKVSLIYLLNGVETVAENGINYPFLKDKDTNQYYVNKVNKLVVGTSGNHASRFSLKTVKIDQIEEEIISSININGNAIPTFDENTSDYLYVLDRTNTLPVITVTGSTNMSNIPPEITLSADSLYYSVKATDVLGFEHTYRVFIYADSTDLKELVLECENLNESDYTEESWSNFVTEYSIASSLIENYSHNYADISSAFTNLSLAKTNLVRVYSATLVFNSEQGNATIANPNQLLAGDVVTINAIPNLGFVLSQILLNNGISDIILSGNTFTMPASDVTVTVIFTSCFSGRAEIGAVYTAIDSITSSLSTVNMTENSTISMQFISVYTPSLYPSYQIGLVGVDGWQFPVGTKITLIDSTDAIKYYYYIVRDAVNSINLNLFLRMGFAAGNNFATSQSSTEITEKLYFILDFTHTSVTSGSVMLLYSNNEGSLTATPPKVVLNVLGDTATINASVSSAPIYRYDEFSIQTIIASNDSVNSNLIDSKYTVVILKNDDTEFPCGVSALSNQELKISGDNKVIVVPAENLGTYIVNFDTLFEGFNTNDVSLKIEFYSSKTAGYYKGGVLIKSTTISLATLQNIPDYAITVTNSADERVIKSDSTTFTLKLDFNQQVLSANSVKILAQKKVEGAYCADATLLTSATSGTVTIGSENGEIEALSLLSETSKTLTLTLGSLTVGTYKIIVTVSDGQGNVNNASVSIIVQ